MSTRAIRLIYTKTVSELEAVEPQDAADFGYLWRDREEQCEFDLNPADQQLYILRPEDVE